MLFICFSLNHRVVVYLKKKLEGNYIRISIVLISRKRTIRTAFKYIRIRMNNKKDIIMNISWMKTTRKHWLWYYNNRNNCKYAIIVGFTPTQTFSQCRIIRNINTVRNYSKLFITFNDWWLECWNFRMFRKL